MPKQGSMETDGNGREMTRRDTLRRTFAFLEVCAIGVFMFTGAFLVAWCLDEMPTFVEVVGGSTFGFIAFVYVCVAVALSSR